MHRRPPEPPYPPSRVRSRSRSRDLESLHTRLQGVLAAHRRNTNTRRAGRRGQAGRRTRAIHRHILDCLVELLKSLLQITETRGEGSWRWDVIKPRIAWTGCILRQITFLRTSSLSCLICENILSNIILGKLFRSTQILSTIQWNCPPTSQNLNQRKALLINVQIRFCRGRWIVWWKVDRSFELKRALNFRLHHKKRWRGRICLCRSCQRDCGVGRVWLRHLRLLHHPRQIRHQCFWD